MRFGIFMPPMHIAGTNPHLALKRDLKLLQVLDELGYHEAWIGEHHSGGSELIASPEVFIATAAERTRSIRLGTGVSSLPYHHPFMLADRMVLLDHLTEGRAMFGVGPGQLTSDAAMLGIDPPTQRPRMEEALDVIVRLLRGETVTQDAGWFTCNEAVLQLKPYTDIEIAVAASISPAGSKLAGRYGAGLLSIAATSPQAVPMLAGHWSTAEEQAALHGTTVSRDRWRLMGPMHIAETFEQAKQNCRHGLQWVFDYLSHVVPTGELPSDYDDLVDTMNRNGQAVIGTPDMAVEQIQRLAEVSGGFGCYLHMGADFADWPATVRHYELFAEHVMPHFTGQREPVVAAYQRVVEAGDQYVTATLNAQMESIDRYAKERAERGIQS